MGGSIAIAVMMEGCSGVVIRIIYYPIMYGELQYYGLRRAEITVVFSITTVFPKYFHSISTLFPEFCQYYRNDGRLQRWWWW